MRFAGMVVTFICLVAFLGFISAPCSADVQISQVKLTSKGINLVKFGIVYLSGDGSTLVAYEKVSDLKLKQQGYVYKLWIIECPGLERDKITYKDIPLPITELQNVSLSNDGRTALITANRGARFLTVDIPSRKVTVIFDHKKGTPGFRSDIGMLYYFKDRFCVWGYFYDSKDIETSRGMTTLDITKSGSDIFKLAFDTKKFEKKYFKSRYLEWVSPHQCFLIGRGKGDKERKLLFFDTNKVKELDHAVSFPGAASSGSRIVYSVMRAKDKSDAFVKDVESGKSWKLNQDSRVYSYAFISRDGGKTVVISDVDVKGNKMNYFYAMEKDNFALKPIKALQNKPICQLRLAPSGETYATFDGNNIYMGKLE